MSFQMKAHMGEEEGDCGTAMITTVEGGTRWPEGGHRCWGAAGVDPHDGTCASARPSS